MASLHIVPFKAKLKDELEIPVARLDGIINTDTVMTFKEYIDKVITKQPKRLILDFSKVTYVSSSGIGELIRLRDSFEQFNGTFIITNPTAEVAHLIRLLGLENILPVLPQIRHAMLLFSKGNYKNTTIAIINKKLRDRLAGKEEAPRFKPMDPLGNYTIIMVPAKDFFTKFLEKRLAGSKGKLKIAKSLSQALKLVKKSVPDMVIIDDAVEGNNDLMFNLKSAMSTNRTRIIKMLRQGTDEKEIIRKSEIYVKEDETILEPFDYNELLALAKKEYLNFKRAKKVIRHSTRFEIVSSEKAIEEVGSILYSFLELAPLSSDQIGEFHVAVKEGIDNAHRHGNKKDESKTIRIGFLLKADRICVTVADEGDGFDYEYYIDAAKRLRPEQLAAERHAEGGVGGMGIAVMKKCSDAISYEAPGNKLILEKKLSKASN